MCRSLPPSHDVSPHLTRWCPRERSSGLPPYWGSERVAVLDLRTLGGRRLDRCYLPGDD